MKKEFIAHLLRTGGLTWASPWDPPSLPSTCWWTTVTPGTWYSRGLVWGFFTSIPARPFIPRNVLQTRLKIQSSVQRLIENKTGDRRFDVQWNRWSNGVYGFWDLTQGEPYCSLVEGGCII